jgi:hypothetical protein
MTDQRIEELEAFARENGLTLPLSPDMIVFFEDHQRIVDLENGEVYNSIVIVPEPCAQAVAYLLADGYADDIEDRDFWSKGQW